MKKILIHLRNNWDTCIALILVLVMFLIKVNCVYNILIKKWESENIE
jgi:hypothetical protein